MCLEIKRYTRLKMFADKKSKWLKRKKCSRDRQEDEANGRVNVKMKMK